MHNFVNWQQTCACTAFLRQDTAVILQDEVDFCFVFSPCDSIIGIYLTAPSRSQTFLFLRLPDVLLLWKSDRALVTLPTAICRQPARCVWDRPSASAAAADYTAATPSPLHALLIGSYIDWTFPTQGNVHKRNAGRH